jgi:dethiobiotin synthetase
MKTKYAEQLWLDLKLKPSAKFGQLVIPIKKRGINNHVATFQQNDVLVDYQRYLRFDIDEMKQTLFITGTDTGVGKTVLTALLTALLTRFLRERGPACGTAALKPICSGTRDDARALHAALNAALTLDEINPWHFRAPIAPLLAARKENRRVKLSQVLAHARAMQKRFEVVLVEGAGGLLSPLGENFNSRDLIVALRAIPIIVARNKLGAVNHVLLTLEALPENLRMKAKIVLMLPPKPDEAGNSNAKLLAEFSNAKIFSLPWLDQKISAVEVLKNPQVRRTLRSLIEI